MADGILSAAVGSILEVLGSQLLQQVQLASGVQEEIQELKDTVETINGVLVDAEKQLNKNEATKVWLRRLNDVVYDADDLLDEFCTQIQLKEMETEVRMFCFQSNHIAYSLKMGNKIKTIREKLERIKSDGQLLHFTSDNEKGVNYHHKERKQTHSFVIEENVIGRDNDKEAIIQLLLDSRGHVHNNVSAVSIVGIGGIGKTTLVQSVYDVEKVKTHFQLRIWVCVSDDFTLRSVVEKILKSLDTRMEMEKLEMDGLQNELRKQIDGKKYLLVLDDVWNKNPNKWSELKDLLANGATGSKILVTTREEGVANIMSRSPLIYELKGLNEDKSWSLFIKIAFGQGKEPEDSRLVAIGKEIIPKCVGVPLAIRTIGNLLYGKGKEFWLSFRDKELSKIPQKEDDILPILKLSYDHLSPPLKHCFAYLALFPKDYEFEKENLIQLWMAQGFLGMSEEDRCLEDVGNEYFMDLLSGSFLQDLKEEEIRQKRVMTCKMHDLMHDLAQSVIGRECQTVTIDACNVGERSRHISFAPHLSSLEISTAMLKANHVGERSRHIWFEPNLSSLEISTALLKANHFRTFLALCSYGKLNNSHFHKILSNFRYLRTLKLSALSIEKVPTSIEKLKLLRYLNLSKNDSIIELPNSMSKLINLQTLDLSDCEGLKKLPTDMSKMVSLQYLLIDGCISLTHMPRGLGQLTSLRRLPLFVVGRRDRTSDALKELNKLDKLRGSLTIKVLGAKENVNLAHPCMSFFTKLTEIKICSSRKCRSIVPLDQLPSVLSLTLVSLYNLEYISESVRGSNSITSAPAASTTFFPSLKELTIRSCKKLKGWWKINDDEDDQVTTTEMEPLISFPCLSKLDIYYCPMLTCMPLYPTLKELGLSNTSPKLLQQTMKMKMKTSADIDVATSSTSSSTSFPLPLSNLKSFRLSDIFNDFESILDLLQRSTSLERMGISIFNSQRDRGYGHMTYVSLGEVLTFSGYDHLDLLYDDDNKLCQWKGLRSIHHLEFDKIETMVHLPKWIHLIATLKHLRVSYCRNLMSFPEGMPLEVLKIYYCPNLMSLPEGMQLEKLVIFGCPHLKERYGNNKCVDWPKIAHIPNISIDLEWIQWDGFYEEDRS